jgi:hypothetical protein
VKPKIINWILYPVAVIMALGGAVWDFLTSNLEDTGRNDW